MRKALLIAVLVSAMAGVFSLTPYQGRSDGVAQCIQFTRAALKDFAVSTAQLCKAVDHIAPGDQMKLAGAKKALVECRLRYKRVEYFLEYFFRSSALIYNGPPKYEVEEPYMEFEAPMGMQVIESMLFLKNATTENPALRQQANAINESATDLGNLLAGFTMDDNQLLESVRIEMTRIITLGISGYDAPLLKSGISESAEALKAIQVCLNPYLKLRSNEADSVVFYLNRSLSILQQSSDFDRFNRLNFLTSSALPLQAHFGRLIRELSLELNTTPALNHDAKNIFSNNALSMDVFPESRPENALVTALGKNLFFETALSGNYSRSCSSCHKPETYFSDQKTTSLAYDGISRVRRNAPSLLYAGYQYSQFWDGRVKSLESQVRNVLLNPAEMNADLTIVGSRLKRNKEYQTKFSLAFSGSGDEAVSVTHITQAIAAYVRSLAPFNSPFDRYLAGDSMAITESQKKGFNLFMGKAQCGTCHFAPLFNGLKPPLYSITEFEVLGLPAGDNLNFLKRDKDDGRYEVFPIRFYKQAFKTPSLRNVAVTAPYMHNGRFKNLEKVIEFYNKGGGNGLGLKTTEQTLSSGNLLLSKLEIEQVISFLNTLTDSLTSDMKRIE